MMYNKTKYLTLNPQGSKGIIPKSAIGHYMCQFHPTSILRIYFLSGHIFLFPDFFLGLLIAVLQKLLHQNTAGRLLMGLSEALPYCHVVVLSI
jgi:hypothetical protein